MHYLYPLIIFKKSIMYRELICGNYNKSLNTLHKCCSQMLIIDNYFENCMLLFTYSNNRGL